MIKPLWAVAGVALLGAAGIGGALIITSSGGEEEVVQQVVTETTTAVPTASGTVAPSTTAATVSTAATPQPSPDQIPADWQTYTDPALDLSLRYPPDLELRDLTATYPANAPNPRALEFRSPSDQSRIFTIGIIETDQGVILDDWVREYTACVTESIEHGSVDGVPAVFCTSVPLNISERAVAFQRDSNVVYIASILPASEFDLVIESLRL